MIRKLFLQNDKFISNKCILYRPDMWYICCEYKLLPASTLSVAPVMNEPPGDSKKQTAEDT